MPSANIFVSDPAVTAKIKKSASEFRGFLAKQLSGKSRQLAAEEISVRLIACDNLGMISPVEIEITAHAYPERIVRQDEICRAAAAFWASDGVEDSHVWLFLCELGHSWEE